MRLKPPSQLENVRYGSFVLKPGEAIEVEPIDVAALEAEGWTRAAELEPEPLTDRAPIRAKARRGDR